MSKKLFEKLECYEGQPVRIYTDDGRVYTGIDLEADDDMVRIIDKCGRLITIALKHVDAFEEPQMELHCCKKNDSCDNND